MELRLWRTADRSRPFQLRLTPHSFCTSVASRELYRPPFFIDAFASISRDRVSLSSHPFGTTASKAEPGPGDAPGTTQTLAVSSTPCHLAGRPSDSLAFRSFPVSRPSSLFPQTRPYGWWVSSNGGSKLLSRRGDVKGKNGSVTVNN